VSALAHFSLEGRTALVTGGSRGIGRAIALSLADAGADVMLAVRDGNGTDTRNALTELGRYAGSVSVDLADATATHAVAAELARDYSIDILVNNAGHISRGPAVDVSPADWAGVVEVNLTAAFLLSQAIGAGMVQRGHGKIINVASLLSFQGGIGVVSYAASKHGLQGLTRALSNEWAASGVQVNAIAPGYIATDNTAPLRSDEARASEILGRIPSGRWGEASDIGGAAIFLASSASDYVTGHTLVVDGGWMAR
jgi:2-deoxy-D-gluconate 3-dehydrogenase